MDMDVLIPEHVVANSDGSYTILINSRLSHERQIEGFNHALEHIKNGDFERNDADKIELKAHALKNATEFSLCGKV